MKNKNKRLINNIIAILLTLFMCLGIIMSAFTDWLYETNESKSFMSFLRDETIKCYKTML